MVWGVAETTTIIVAASIPAFRVLVREVKSSTRQRYAQTAEHTCTTYKKGVSRNNTVIVTARAKVRGRRSSQSSAFVSVVRGDDRSDRSILPHVLGSVSGNKILQTQEVAVEYHDRGELDDRMDFEMGRVERMG